MSWRFEPRTAGWEGRTLLLCCAVWYPPSRQNQPNLRGIIKNTKKFIITTRTSPTVWKLSFTFIKTGWGGSRLNDQGCRKTDLKLNSCAMSRVPGADSISLYCLWRSSILSLSNETLFWLAFSCSWMEMIFFQWSICCSFTCLSWRETIARLLLLQILLILSSFRHKQQSIHFYLQKITSASPSMDPLPREIDRKIEKSPAVGGIKAHNLLIMGLGIYPWPTIAILVVLLAQFFILHEVKR